MAATTLIIHPASGRKGMCVSSERAKIGMILSPDRMAYLGLLGSPTTRTFGAITIYCSLRTPLRFSRNGRMWEEASAFVVPAYAPHQIASDHPIIGVLMLEPETIDRSQLPQFLRPDTWDMKRFPDAIHRIREGFSSFSSRQTDKTIDSIDIDFWFFGQRLPEPPTDMRIGPIIHLLRTEPGSLASAEEGARLCNLSMSRFLHRFKAYTGATFRGFRAWKRARSFLRYVNGNAALTDIALEIGYADSSHFSNSIRQMYGLTPRDIFKGSRQLHIYIQSTTGDASSRWPCEIQPAAAAIGADCPTAIGSVTETTRIHVSATDCHLSA